MPKKGLTGKVLRPNGSDVSDRDRSKDGTIIVRRGREEGHNYFFGSIPEMPWVRMKRRRRFERVVWLQRIILIAISIITICILRAQ